MSWWVAQTVAQREHLVRVLLMKRGFTTYAPRIKHHGRIAWLFPTYVFVRACERFYPVVWCNGVVRVLMTGERPGCLEDTVIDGLQADEKGGFLKMPMASKALVKGQNVRISNGSFCGQIGLFDGQSSKERVHVLLELLGRKVSVELKESDVAPLDVVANR